QDKLRNEIKQEWKRNDDAGIKGEAERDGERISDGEGTERADRRVDIAQRSLHDLNQGGAKAEADHHRENEGDRHLHDRPTKVLEMFEERLGGFALRRVPEFENVAQPHDLQFAEGEQAAGEQPRADRERVRVANLVARDHAAQFFRGESAAIEDRFRFVARMAGGAFADRPGEEKIAALIGKSGRSKVIAERNEIAAFSEFESRFFAQFAERDRGDFVRLGFRFVVDLARRHFPDRGADRDSLLANQDQFSFRRHRRDHHGLFSPDNGPRARLPPIRSLNFFRDDFDVLVFEARFARHDLPAVLHAGKIMGRAAKSECFYSRLFQRAIWAATFSGDGAPGAVRFANEARTSNTFKTSS